MSGTALSNAPMTLIPAAAGGAAVADRAGGVAGAAVTHRERELGAIIHAYNEVTERLKLSHDQLTREVGRLREELARKNQELRRRERLASLGELAAGVAHEIRNPLGGIRVFASLLRRDLAGQPAALRLVEKISSGVMGLERIVTDILEFGRPAEPNPEPTALRDLLVEVAELAGGRRSGDGSGVQVDAPAVSFETDGAMLQRALLNLVLNGIEAARTAAQPAVRLCGRTVGDRVVIVVLDNGPGLRAELLDRIFDPFFTTKDTGTGLGLAIVHQIVEALGGSIQAGNRPEGGAMFTVQLPLAAERGGGAPRVQPARTGFPREAEG